MYDGYSVTVVLPAFNEEQGLILLIPDLKKLNFVDEILVVNNNSTDNSEKIAILHGARVVLANTQGYGAALKKGITNAKGDLIITIEADCTFQASDILKFLPYINDAEFILGTRTANSLIWQGAYMPLWVKWGNWFVAKLIEFLFNGPSLTDAGCTFKLIKKSAISKLNLKLLTNHSHFNAELLLAICASKFKAVEIPVNYYPRQGISKITGNSPTKTILLGLRMIRVILRAWILKTPYQLWISNE